VSADRADLGLAAAADAADPGLAAADSVSPGRAPEAALAIMRLFRALEHVQTGLTARQYRILKLAGAGGERSARLAQRLAVAKPTLTATADGLVAAGLAERTAEPGDRRVVRLCLTAAGRAAVERADTAYAQWLGSLLAGTGDPAGVLAALARLDAALDDRRGHRAGPAAPGSPSAPRGSPSAPRGSPSARPAAPGSQSRFSPDERQA